MKTEIVIDDVTHKFKIGGTEFTFQASKWRRSSNGVEWWKFYIAADDGPYADVSREDLEGLARSITDLLEEAK